MALNKKSSLFIVGCPRSGTTAMGTLVTTHPSVVMGIERYGHRVQSNDFTLTPDLFERERFCDIQEGDTFYSSFDFAPRAYTNIEKKFETPVWVGDKIPTLYGALPQLFETFGDDVYVIFMIRNIFDIAASYVARKNDPEDSWNKDVASAITDWGMSIKSYRTSAYKDRILPIVYEDFFHSEQAMAQLLQHLNLNVGPEEKAVIRGLVQRSAQLTDQRPRNLSGDDVMEISMTAPFGGYRELVKEAREKWAAIDVPVQR